MRRGHSVTVTRDMSVGIDDAMVVQDVVRGDELAVGLRFVRICVCASRRLGHTSRSLSSMMKAVRSTTLSDCRCFGSEYKRWELT